MPRHISPFFRTSTYSAFFSPPAFYSCIQFQLACGIAFLSFNANVPRTTLLLCLCEISHSVQQDSNQSIGLDHHSRFQFCKQFPASSPLNEFTTLLIHARVGTWACSLFACYCCVVIIVLFIRYIVRTLHHPPETRISIVLPTLTMYCKSATLSLTLLIALKTLETCLHPRTLSCTFNIAQPV